MSFANSERHGLADLLLERGPDAPTLCEGWTTADLAVHLWVREHRPDAIVGMVASPVAGHLEAVSKKVKAQDYYQLVEKWRAGPPKLSPFGLLDAKINLTENFVHHGDVRRAGSDWDVRELDAQAIAGLRKALPTLAKVFLRKSRVPVVLNPHGLTPVTVGGTRGVVEHGDDVVRVSGAVGELILWVFGRSAVDVTIDGDQSKIIQSSL